MGVVVGVRSGDGVVKLAGVSCRLAAKGVLTMPKCWIVLAGLLALVPLANADKKEKAEKAGPEQKLVASGEAGDEKVGISARVFLDRDSTKQAVGEDPGVGYIVVEVTITAKGEEKVSVDLDDFLLRSDKDGQHSRPLTPSQVAGNAVMVVKSVGGSQGRGMGQQNRVPYGYPGGYPGGSPGGGYPGGGYPQTMPGAGSPTAGSATADTSDAAASIEDKGKGKPNPLLDALKAKVLKDGEIDHSVAGLLYFQIDGKVKPKQLELVYRKSPPRVSVRFVDPNAKKK
jgi:hypothetical protein